ncbi:hypothetical protein B5F35_03895 [Anaeromassilibacillus sp. An200]|nr:hypothetical protein B5F35_03895 [Anaeromassilibacillus sp. An200]
MCYNRIKSDAAKNRAASRGSGSGCAPRGVSLEIREFFTNVYGLQGNELIAALCACAKIFTVKRGELLVREGDPVYDAFFLVSGVFRGYFLDANGKEITDCLSYRSGTPLMTCLGFDEVSCISVMALSGGVCLSVPIAELLSLFKQYPELLELYNRFLVDSLRYHWKMKTMLYQYTAMQRYQWFCETHPGLIDLVGGKYVASFLNMTPVTLSRLRRELREQ